MTAASLYTAAGLAGALVMLAAYAALQLGFIRGRGYYYAGMNAVGAGLMLLSLQQAFNLSAVLMQVAWISISVIGIVRYYVLTHTSRFTDEEKEFLEAAVPGLERVEARQLLDIGHWADGAPGERLTVAGEHNHHIYYLLTGAADVRSGDTVIARLGDHAFVGDMSLVTRDAASATVTLTETSRYLVFPITPLERLLERDAEIRRHLKATLSGHLASKLLRTTHDLADSHAG